MKRFAEWTILVGVCLSLSACVIIHSAAISERAHGGPTVKTEYEDWGILHVTVPPDLTANANSALAAQCQSGMISSVQTELSMRDWLAIVQVYTIDATAVCK